MSVIPIINLASKYWYSTIIIHLLADVVIFNVHLYYLHKIKNFLQCFVLPSDVSVWVDIKLLKNLELPNKVTFILVVLI